MSDIVERLRSGAAHETLVTTGLVNQAADEIIALRAKVEKLRVAISWLEPPFVDDKTPGHELRLRIGFCIADASRVELEETP